jgi:hypothetical protein
LRIEDNIAELNSSIGEHSLKSISKCQQGRIRFSSYEPKGRSMTRH